MAARTRLAVGARVAVRYPAAAHIAGRVGRVVSIDDESPTHPFATLALDPRDAEEASGGTAQVALAHLILLCHEPMEAVPPASPCNLHQANISPNRVAAATAATHATTPMTNPAWPTPATIGFRPLRSKRSRRDDDEDEGVDQELSGIHRFHRRRNSSPTAGLKLSSSSSEDEVHGAVHALLDLPKAAAEQARTANPLADDGDNNDDSVSDGSKKISVSSDE